ncbi:lycopene cyclase [Flagellimonas alvinocaridis]|uniref:Lycopene cyclase n=1 Tax=Flagellimonas alvinocaridis TaxID=2530200 RepID=A0A4S8RQT4_9FLAO|nr:lycopene cyclase family protein [Allomuricauda alvinocaridis]THV61057.1 lycopene cyclase [Allomuricauda alvinocaridis]
MSQYDYIIVGAGAAGILLAHTMGKDAFFASKSILVLDKDAKNENNRTWCFWETGTGDFDDLLYKTWDTIHVAGKKLTLSTPIAPYTYKMLRGIDFYSKYVPEIKSCPNITWIQDEVTHLQKIKKGAIVHTKGDTFLGKMVFSSLVDWDSISQQDKFPVLQQHFLGWFIKAGHPIFNPEEATFMDFSVPQKGNTRFMYVLPTSTTEALVEYTLFSEHLLEKSEYEEAIKEYLHEKYGVTDYSISQTEFGSIPMTCYPFHQHNSDTIFHIGIAGGWAKPSTGFTFYNTSKQIMALVNHLKQEKPLGSFHKKTRFQFYDSLLLDILHRENHLGQSIFESLFAKRKASVILKFLGNETHLGEELQIVTAPKPRPFLKALFRRIF